MIIGMGAIRKVYLHPLDNEINGEEGIPATVKSRFFNFINNFAMLKLDI